MPPSNFLSLSNPAPFPPVYLLPHWNRQKDEETERERERERVLRYKRGARGNEVMTVRILKVARWLRKWVIKVAKEKDEEKVGKRRKEEEDDGGGAVWRR